MKRILCVLLAFILLFSICACKSASNNDTDDNNNPIVDNTGESITDSTESTGEDLPEIKQLPIISVSLPITTETEKATDGTVIFEHNYQSIALSINDANVADRIILDFLARIDQTQSYADSVLTSARADYNGGNWIPYQYSISYKPMRIDGGVLSLFGADTSYIGSSHPDAHYCAVNYDLVTGEVLTLADILSSNTTAKTLTDATLQILETIKDEYRLYIGFESVVKDRFNKNFSADESWYFSNKGLCFYFPPYEIAPYISGVVVAEIPYEKLTGILKDDYFPAEREPAYGSILTEAVTAENLSKYTQFAEITLHSEGTPFLLYTDGAVYNISLQTAVMQSGVTTSLYTTFAATSLTPGDAIMVQGNPTLDTEFLILTYESNGVPVKVYLYADGFGNIAIHNTTNYTE